MEPRMKETEKWGVGNGKGNMRLVEPSSSSSSIPFSKVMKCSC